MLYGDFLAGQTIQEDLVSKKQNKIKIRYYRAVVPSFNPCTSETEAGGSQLVRGQSGLPELVTGQVPKLQRKKFKTRCK